MTVGDRIRHKRKELGLTQEELAKKLGYKSRSSVNKMETSRELPLKKVKMMANILECDPSYLMGWTGTNQENTLHKKGVTINVLGRVAAGIPIEAIENIVDTEEITQEMASGGDFFGLKVRGDSMEPRIYEGDVLIVKKQNDAENGDIVIALVNGNEATCKRLFKYSEGINLISLNNKYDPMQFTNKEIAEKPVRIIGKVVELRGKL